MLANLGSNSIMEVRATRNSAVPDLGAVVGFVDESVDSYFAGFGYFGS